MKAADYLEITEICPDGSQHHVPLADITTLTIGRSPKCDIQISWTDGISRIQATIYAVDNKDRGHRDYYVRDGGVRDGEWMPSQSGVWSDGTQLSSHKGFRLGPGAAIDIFPQVKGYRCLLEWPAEKEADDDTNPTVGFQNRLKKEQIEARDAQIKGLQILAESLDSKLKEVSNRLVDERANFDQYLASQSERMTSVDGALQTERETNDVQNKKISDQAKKLEQLRKVQLLASGTVLGALLLSMGVEIEEMQQLLNIVAGLAAAGGVAYSVSQG